MIIGAHSISNPSVREPFRRSLVTATAAATFVAGKGLAGYLEAFDAIVKARGR